MRRRRLRSFYAVFTLLLFSPGLLAAAHAFALPWAVKEGLLDGTIEKAIGDALGTPVRIDRARLVAKDVLEVRGLRLLEPAAGFTDVVIDEVRVRFDGPVPGGSPTAIEAAWLEAAFDLDSLRRGDDVTVPSAVLQDLRELPAIDLRAAKLKVRSGDAVDAIDEIMGRYAPSDGAMEMSGNFGGAGPGTFRLSGRIDPGTGAPSLSIATQSSALPLNIERILSQLAGTPVRSAAQRTLTLKEGRVSTVSMDFEPGVAELADGTFRVEIAHGPDGTSVSAGIPAVEIRPGGYRVVFFGGFRVKGADGSARFVLQLFDGDSAEALEEADVLLYDLGLDGDALHGEGLILLSDGREVEITLDQMDDVALSLQSRGWDLAREWRLPWALSDVTPPSMEGVAELTLEATIREDGVDLAAAVAGEGLSFETWTFDSGRARASIRRDGEATQVAGRVEVGAADASLDLAFAATRADEAWAGSASGELTLDGGAYALERATWSIRDGALTVAGVEATLPGGGRLVGGAATWGQDEAYEGELKGVDLGALGERMLDRIGADEAGGVVDGRVSSAEGRTDLRVAARERAWVRRGDARFEFRGASYVRAPSARGERHAVSFDDVRARWRDLEFESASASVDIDAGPADEAGGRPVAWTIALGGGRFLRGIRYVDTEEAPIVIAGEGTWTGEAERLDGAATVRVEGWGEARLEGRLARREGEIDFALTGDVSGVPLRRAQQALNLAIDTEGIRLDGTITARLHAIRDAAGFSLEGEISRAEIASLAWEDWTFEGVTLRLPLHIGVARGEGVERAGEATIRSVRFPGGSARDLSTAFQAKREGDAWRIRGSGELAGTFCNGAVTVGGVTVTLAADGEASATLEAKVRGLDLAAFSDVVGMEKPLTGTFDADYKDVRVSEAVIDFGGGTMTGQGLFSGRWAVDALRIEDPFGPDTSYGFRSTFDDVNLRHVSRYLIDSSITRHGLIHGRAGGEFALKMLHDGDIESFEVYTHTQRQNDVRQFIYRDAARTLASTFGRADLATEMKQLPERTTYFGLALHAKMGLDRQVWLRGGYYKTREGDPAREYTLEEIRAGADKGEDFILIGSGLHKVDIPVSMIEQPIGWSAFRGRLDPDATEP